MAITLGGGGSASAVNEKKEFNSAENLITLDDGRVYLKGGVTSTDTATYPDASTKLTYSGTSFSIASQGGLPISMTWDGTYFWVLNNTSGGNVFKYNSSGVYQNVTFSVGSQTGNALGIVWDGTYFWIGGYTQKSLFKYNSSGVYQNVSISISQITNPRDIAWDGSHFYVSDNEAQRIYKYNSSGTYIGNFLITQNTQTWGITWDGTYFWVTSSTNDTAYAYDASFVYQNISFSFASQETTPRGMGAQGSSLWVVGTSASGSLFKYSPQIGIGSQGGTEYGNQNYMRIK